MAIERRFPVQGRGKETRRRILEAAREIIAEKGWARTGTREVAARAGIGVATLYGYFAAMRPILVELFEEHYSELAAKMMNLAESAPVRGAFAVDAFLRGVLAAHREEGSFHFEMLSLAAKDEDIARRARAFDDAIVEGLARLIEGAGARIRSGDREAVARVAYRASEALIHDLAATPSPTGEGSMGGALLTELSAMLGAYLFPDDRRSDRSFSSTLP